MAKADRRDKKALDESYKYYRHLDQNHSPPELYRLANTLKTLTKSLLLAEDGQLKLTRQLWKRVQQALFDKLITSFPGYVLVSNEDGEQVSPKHPFPDEGMVEFHPDGCKRADDIFRMEIKHLYPTTFYNLSKAWKDKGATVQPGDFGEVACSEMGCPVKPAVYGLDVIDAESTQGKQNAYQQYWDLYWQAYCTRNRSERSSIFRQMDELESVWGTLYY